MAVHVGHAFCACISAFLSISSKLAVESKARCEKHVVLQCISLHTIGPRAEVLGHQVKQTLTTLLIYNEKVYANSLGAMTSTTIYLPKRNCDMKIWTHNCQHKCSMLQQHANAARASCILDIAMQKQGIKHAQHPTQRAAQHTKFSQGSVQLQYNQIAIL